jgi:RNA 3'-terminal phosphate cyclase
LPDDQQRHKPRKHIRSYGEITIADEHIPCAIRDLSLGGALVHIKPHLDITENTDARVVLDGMDVEGAVTVRWSGSAPEGGTLIGLKFEHLEGKQEFHKQSTAAETFYQKRRDVRRPDNQSGTLQVHEQQYTFDTRDMSLGGVAIHTDQKCSFTAGTTVNITLDALKVRGDAIVRWVRPDEGSGTIIGLKFIQLEGIESK